MIKRKIILIQSFGDMVIALNYLKKSNYEITKESEHIQVRTNRRKTFICSTSCSIFEKRKKKVLLSIQLSSITSRRLAGLPIISYIRRLGINLCTLYSSVSLV